METELPTQHIANEALSERKKAALEAAFEDWYARNFNIISDGGHGDVVQLFIALKTASEKS